MSLHHRPLFFALALGAIALSGCVKLSASGQRVQLLEAPAAPPACDNVGSVTVSSADALRNAAAAAEADTAWMEPVSTGGMSFIRGKLFRCHAVATTEVSSAPAPSNTPRTPLAATTPAAPASAAQNDANSRKSGLCASKGGQWDGEKCFVIIPLD